MPPKHHEPARGALAGIKADAEKAKQAVLEHGGGYAAAVPGVGAAWSHNFLNQKPWHPLNFRNQMRVWEAQQQSDKDEKSRAVAKAEFDAEQEYIKTLSYLTPEDQQKHLDRQGVSFMYQKPPGYDAAMAKASSAQEHAQQEGSGAAAPGQAGAASAPEGGAQQQSERQRHQPELPQNYVANMLGAINALHQHEKYEVKHISGTGRRSPPRGGLDPSAHNQQLLADDDDDDEDATIAGPSAHPGDDGDDPNEVRKRRKLAQAEAYLKAAGLDPSMLGMDAHKKKKKKGKRDKAKKAKKGS